MDTETIIVFPNVTAAISGVAAVAIGIDSVDVEFTNQAKLTQRFARHYLRQSNTDEPNFDLAARVTHLAHEHGRPVNRRITRIAA